MSDFVHEEAEADDSASDGSLGVESTKCPLSVSKAKKILEKKKIELGGKLKTVRSTDKAMWYYRRTKFEKDLADDDVFSPVLKALGYDRQHLLGACFWIPKKKGSKDYHWRVYKDTLFFGFGEVFETNKKDNSSYTSLVSFRLTKADDKAVLVLWKVSPDNVHPCNVQGCV